MMAQVIKAARSQASVVTSDLGETEYFLPWARSEYDVNNDSIFPIRSGVGGASDGKMKTGGKRMSFNIWGQG